VRHAGDGVGDQVVVLGGLQWDAHAVALAELAGPHARGVDDDLGFDAALVGVDRRHPAAFGLDAGHGDALDHAARCASPLAIEVATPADRRGPRRARKAGQHIGGVNSGHALFPGTDLVLVDPESVHPRRRGGSASSRCGLVARLMCRVEPGGVTGLLLEAFVQVAGVAAQEQRGLVRHPRRGDQPGGVPGGARGEFMLLEQPDVSQPRCARW
jgi:hypothetical protein